MDYKTGLNLLLCFRCIVVQLLLIMIHCDSNCSEQLSSLYLTPQDLNEKKLLRRYLKGDTVLTIFKGFIQKINFIKNQLTPQ